MPVFGQGMVAMSAAKEAAAESGEAEAAIPALSLDYVPQVRYVRRTLLPVAVITLACFFLAFIFEIVACASKDWASFDFGEKNVWGLWQACNIVDGCASITSPQSKLHVSASDVSTLKACQALIIINIFLLPLATPFFALSLKRSFKWSLYGLAILGLWTVLWIAIIALFAGLDIFVLLSAALDMTTPQFYSTGMILHIIALVLVITGLLVHFVSYFTCFVVDVYDDYGNLIATREDAPGTEGTGYSAQLNKSAELSAPFDLDQHDMQEKAAQNPTAEKARLNDSSSEIRVRHY